MATPRAYWNALKATRNKVALQMGVDATLTPKDMRAISSADLAAVVVLIKALTDNNILTDAQLAAAQTSVEVLIQWDDEPDLP